jgi:hypothetical protein
VSRIVRYVGGPLDGLEVDVTDVPSFDPSGGAYQVVDGWSDRADYEPEAGGDPLVWVYRGPVSG